MTIAILTTVLGALLLDLLFGETTKFHPLVGFGRLANWVESRLNLRHDQLPDSLTKSTQEGKPDPQYKTIMLGSVAVALLISPFALLFSFVSSLLSSVFLIILNLIVLYWAIGHQSLREHALRVLDKCLVDDLTAAQQQLGMIVSRNTEKLDQEQVVQATVETVLENGNDAIFAPVFWFCLLEAIMVFFGVGLGTSSGAVAVIIYRLSNTLDAMWGYRNPRFYYFGRFAARLDDVLNYIPARLVALSYALLGNTKQALWCWKEQSDSLKSPNAGPVMTAGAGGLDVRLGGPTYYHGVYTEKPFFGSDTKVNSLDIGRSLQLIRNTIVLWCFAITIAIVITIFISHSSH